MVSGATAWGGDLWLDRVGGDRPAVAQTAVAPQHHLSPKSVKCGTRAIAQMWPNPKPMAQMVSNGGGGDRPRSKKPTKFALE